MKKPLPGNGHPRAVYIKQVIKFYAENSFIEALPEILTDEQEILRMQRIIVVGKDERLQPAHIRYHMVYAIPGGFMQPLTDHLLLAKEVSAMIRVGYVARNPSSPTFLRKVGLAVQAMSVPGTRRSSVSGHGIAIIGMSGVGKSTAIDEVLQGYPQVIWHPKLSGQLRATYQLPWIKVTCPPDGSIKSVCRSFFIEVDLLLGTNYNYLYARNGTLDTMRDAMAQIVLVHGVGLLVIDEVQNLRRAKGVSAAVMLNFFLVLRDVLKVPVIVVGTEAAEAVLGGEFKVARRHAGAPLFERMENGPVFERFCKSLFAAYYLQEPFEPTPAFNAKLYNLSQGISDITIKLFTLAQMRALNLGLEYIDMDIVHAVYDDCLGLLHEHLSDIRNGRQVDGVAYEAAMHNASIDRLTAATSVVRPHDEKEARPKRILRSSPNFTTPARPQRAALPTEDRGIIQDRAVAGEVCELGLIVQHKHDEDTAYNALKKAGYIRDLGAEIISGD